MEMCIGIIIGVFIGLAIRQPIYWCLRRVGIRLPSL